jgi:hypothetical protein
MTTSEQFPKKLPKSYGKMDPVSNPLPNAVYDNFSPSTEQVALEELQKEGAFVKGRGRSPRFSTLQAEEIMQDPRTAAKIAEDYGVHPNTIHRIKNFSTKGYHTLVEPVKAPRGGRPILDDDTYAKIRDASGKLKDVAAQFGISVSTAWRVRNNDYCGRSPDALEDSTIVAVVGGKPLFKRDLEKPKRRRSKEDPCDPPNPTP